jgi:hypothetical protein
MPAETERPKHIPAETAYLEFPGNRGSVGLGGGGCSQLRTGLDLKFPVKGHFAGNFREKLPVPQNRT